MMTEGRSLRITILDGQMLNPGDLSWEPFSQLGEVEIYPNTRSAQIVERSQESVALIVNKVPIDASVMATCPHLKYVGVTATGYNNVDIEAAQARGVTVCNVPEYGTASVAQMVFAHILNHACQLMSHVNSVAQGDWSQSPAFCYTVAGLSELQGKTLGIVGLGRTGQQTGAIATAFGMRVMAYHYQPMDSPYDLVPLDTLFAQSDYVSLHVPLTTTTAALVNRERLALMPTHAFLVNTARGGLVVEQDLADALNGGQIAGAGLDVLATEPPSPDNPLLKAKNCFITPHIAWITKAARQRLLQQSVDNVNAWLAGQPINVVR